MLKIGSLGNVKSHTMRAFRRNEMEKIWRRSNSFREKHFGVSSASVSWRATSPVANYASDATRINYR
jgi:hypothetical protein